MSEYLPMGAANDSTAPYNEEVYLVRADLTIILCNYTFTSPVNLTMSVQGDIDEQSLHEFAVEAVREECYELSSEIPEAKISIISITKTS